MSFPPPFVSHRVHPAIKKGDFSGPGGGRGPLGQLLKKDGFCRRSPLGQKEREREEWNELYC